MGIWGTDPWNPDDGSGPGDDGVLLMHPHESYVSALGWADDGKVVTAAYDGMVQMLDVAAATWTVLRRDSVDGFSAMALHQPHTLLLASDAVRTFDRIGWLHMCCLHGTLGLVETEQHLQASVKEQRVGV